MNTKLGVDGIGFALANCYSAKITEFADGDCELEIRVREGEGLRRLIVPAYKWVLVKERYYHIIDNIEVQNRK